MIGTNQQVAPRRPGPLAPVQRAPEAAGSTSTSGPGRRIEVIELAVFVSLIAPAMALSALMGHEGLTIGWLTLVGTLVQEAALVGLIAYFLWRNGESRARLGWGLRGAGRDVIYGLLLFLPLSYLVASLERWLIGVGLTGPSVPLHSPLAAGGPLAWVAGFVIALGVAVAEETIFRGYLLLRLRNTTGSTWAAVVVSSAVFAMGHGYEGTAGVATVFALGVCFAVLYLWRRSLVLPVVLHFLQDFLGLVVVPFLARGH